MRHSIRFKLTSLVHSLGMIFRFLSSPAVTTVSVCSLWDSGFSIVVPSSALLVFDLCIKKRGSSSTLGVLCGVSKMFCEGVGDDVLDEGSMMLA